MITEKLTSKNILATVIIFAFLFLFPSFSAPAFAAQINFAIDAQDLHQGDEFTINANLDTGGQSVNAVEGKLTFPPDTLDVKSVSDGNSVVNFWVERPNASQAGVVSFSGIIPGGISSNNSRLFSIIFKAKNAGGGLIGLNDLKILLNDGNGTPAPITASSLQLSIGPSSGQPPKVVSTAIAEDKVAPESFQATIASDPNAFDGKYFIAFSTQDKNSGLDRYEVKEGFFGKYEKTESPYVLKNQKVATKVHIKAIDKSGNERIESVYPPNWMLRQNMPFWAIVLLIIIVGLWIRRGRAK